MATGQCTCIIRSGDNLTFPNRGDGCFWKRYGRQILQSLLITFPFLFQLTISRYIRRIVFEEYNGSFVLYNATEDSWQIYNKEYATARISPASTFKIYSALFSLETGIITPEQSLIPWDGQHYTYDSWNADQTLESAMQNSVTWYFQALDRQTGLSAIKEYIQKIGYGSQTVEGDISSYWINSSLKISPVEIWGILYFAAIFFAWVPLPAPGAPNIIIFILLPPINDFG